MGNCYVTFCLVFGLLFNKQWWCFKKKKGRNLAFNCGNLSGTLPHVCFKCHWTTTRVLYRTANCCIEMYIFVKIFLLKACLLSLCIFSLCIKTDGVRLKKKNPDRRVIQMFVSYLPLFKHFLFSNKYELKDKRTFCLASFHGSCHSTSSSNYRVFSHQHRRLVFDIDYAPGGRWEPSKWHFNRLSSLSVWICVKLTALRAELDGSLSSLVGLIASVSLG